MSMQNKYPGLTFSSDKDSHDFKMIHDVLDSVFGSVDPEILMDAYFDRNTMILKSANDYYYLVTKSLIKHADITKKAYPVGGGSFTEDPFAKVDMENWITLVHKIYSAVQSGSMTFPNALDYYSGTLNVKSGESDNFKKWLTYYKDGEHQKYSEGEEVGINKKSDYQFGLNSTFYPGDNVPTDESVSQKLQKMEDQGKKTDEFGLWKSKLNGAIRRIDKLLRTDDHLSAEEQQDLAEMLHSFDLQVRKVRLQSLGEDITFRAATQFKKVGFSQGSDILMKIAQELGDTPAPPGDIGAPAPEPALPGGEQPAPGAAPISPGGASDAIGRALEAGESGDKKGDVFDELAQTGGQIDLSQAAIKLEEVAARLADRRTIRQLAEFDIMLDKLGIASLFPELAEAQSKLIDAYSYALVRVTKMLGMLSSGRSMSDISQAKKTDISNKAIREVNKTFNQGEEPVAGGKGTDALNQEFGPGDVGQEAQPQPVE